MKKLVNPSASILVIFLFISAAVQAQSTGGPYIADENTLLLMHFDGDVTESASSYAISNHGIAKTYINSPILDMGNAIHFDNSGAASQSYLTVAHSTELSLTNNWTIEFWFQINAWDQTHNSWPVPIVLPTSGWDANYYLEIPASWGLLKYGFHSSAGGPVIYSSSNSITTGVWYHTALINDYDNHTLKLAIRNADFQLIEEQTADYTAGIPISTGSQDLRIGAGLDTQHNYFNGYIDELRISNVVRDFSSPTPNDMLPLQAQTTDIDFYSANADAGNWTPITQDLQQEFIELSSLWNRPGAPPMLPEGSRIKMVLVDRDSLLTIAPSVLPSWQCGLYDSYNQTVYLAPPEGTEQLGYYGSFASLAKNYLAQLMLKYHLTSLNNNSSRFDLFEGFGLYRGGYRPDRAVILQAISDLGRLPSRADIEYKTNLTTGYMKDLIVAYIEGQLLSRMAYSGISTWMGDDYWHPYFENYFQKPEDDCIQLRGQSANFDIYCAAQDVQFLDRIEARLEEKLTYYSTTYSMNIDHRFNIVIFPDVATGMACMNFFDNYNGGGGWGGDKLDVLSPLHFTGGIDEMILSMVPHEFWHIFHHHMAPLYTIIPFHAEGMAEFMTYGATTPEYLDARATYIKYMIQQFEQNNGHEPSLADFMADATGALSVYTFGQAFWFYMHENHADHETIKLFFNSGSDWTVFSESYSTIETGYKNYVWDIAGLATSVDQPGSQAPNSFSLEQNYPNPFNPSTTISFSLPVVSSVKLTVFDVTGQELELMISGEFGAGVHQVTFVSPGLSSGVYFYTLQADGFSQTRKMLLMK